MRREGEGGGEQFHSLLFFSLSSGPRLESKLQRTTDDDATSVWESEVRVLLLFLSLHRQFSGCEMMEVEEKRKKSAVAT